MATNKKNTHRKNENNLKRQIEAYIENDFENFIEEIQTLDPKERVKIKLDLLKIVAPKPAEKDENINHNTINSQLMQKLFGKNEKKQE